MSRPTHIIDLLPSAHTDWQLQQRIQGRLDLPASPQGLHQITQQITTWAPDPLPRLIHCAPDEASRQTADRFAARCGPGIRIKPCPDLYEIDLGLWQGLEYAQVKERYPSAYAHWKSQPAMVAPPEGEALPQFAQRTLAAVTRLIDKADGTPIALVLRPVMLAVTTAWLAGREPLSVLPQQPTLPQPLRQILDDSSWQQLRRNPTTPTTPRKIPA
jgi:probable phosphoglycerate mutase